MIVQWIGTCVICHARHTVEADCVEGYTKDFKTICMICDDAVFMTAIDPDLQLPEGL